MNPSPHPSLPRGLPRSLFPPTITASNAAQDLLGAVKVGLLQHDTAEHSSRTSRVAFRRDAEGFQRFLTVGGQDAFALGNICTTCHFVFERLSGCPAIASFSMSPDAMGARLERSEGLFDPEFQAAVLSALPSGSYTILHQKAVPVRTSPGAPDDYFANECAQVYTWRDGIHSPKTDYFRLPDVTVSASNTLFQFIVPFQDLSALDPERVRAYQRVCNSGSAPTALALAVLDVEGPPTSSHYIEHSVIAHYLLDGHHKVQAAAALGAPIGLLSFVNHAESLADPGEVDAVVDALRHAA